VERWEKIFWTCMIGFIVAVFALVQVNVSTRPSVAEGQWSSGGELQLLYASATRTTDSYIASGFVFTKNLMPVANATVHVTIHINNHVLQRRVLEGECVTDNSGGFQLKVDTWLANFFHIEYVEFNVTKEGYAPLYAVKSYIT